MGASVYGRTGSGESPNRATLRCVGWEWTAGVPPAPAEDAGERPAVQLFLALRLGHPDRADRLRAVDAEHDAFADVELVVDAVVVDIAGAEVLALHQHADAGVDESGAVDRGLVDAGGA